MTDLRREIGESRLLGTFVQTPHPIIPEVFSGLGFDLLCIDREHSAVDPGTLVELVRGAEVAGLPALVRVADNTTAAIAEALDAGAAGVLVPRVESALEAAAVVSAARFPPLGKRGAGPGRAALYGRTIGSYIATANSRLLVAIQIETALGVEQLADILAVDGIDVIFIGPTDLALSLGYAANLDHSDVRGVIDEVIEKSLAAERHVGIFVTSAEAAREWLGKGCRLILLASDLIFMTQAAAAASAGLRAELDV